MKSLSIGSAANLLGITPQTLRRWEKAGKFPADFRTLGNHRRYRLDTLLRFANAVSTKDKTTVCYSRVSCSDQRDDLLRQEQRLLSWCQEHGHTNTLSIRDQGSGLNTKKRGLLKRLGMICPAGAPGGEVGTLVIENNDRLLRVGADLVFSLCHCFSVDVVVTDQPPEEAFEKRLVDDVLAVITVMSARLYGRSAGPQPSHKRRPVAGAT